MRNLKANLTKTWLLLPLLLLGGIVAACGDDDEETNGGGGSGTEEDETMRRTVLVYLIAENDLADASTYDIDEILSASKAGNIPSDCNVAVYHDGVGMPRITLYKKKKSKTLKTWEEDQNSADSTVMLQVLKEMIELAPAEHYSLVLWSHGDGWLPTTETKNELFAYIKEKWAESTKGTKGNRSFGMDNGLNKKEAASGSGEMNISSIRWALEKLNIHFDYILWDACDMQTIEVAYELRNQADWIIGSPTEASGYGAPYTTAAKAMCEADIEGIMKAYQNYYSRLTEVNIFPLSAVKTSELQALANATAPLVAKYFSGNLPEGEKSAQVYSSRDLIEATEEEGAYIILGAIRYDMGSLMHNVLTTEEYNQWRPLLDKAVPYKITPKKSWAINEEEAYYNTMQDAEHYSGIAMNVPQWQYDLYLFGDYSYLPLCWNIYFKSAFSWWKAGGWADTGLDQTYIFAVNIFK